MSRPLALILFVSACSGGGTGPGDAGTIQVTAPQTVLVPGETVRWVFNGSNTHHSVTAEDASLFDSGFIFQTPGDFFELTFGPDQANRRIEYFCRSHRAFQMEGAVEVGG